MSVIFNQYKDTICTTIAQQFYYLFLFDLILFFGKVHQIIDLSRINYKNKT